MWRQFWGLSYNGDRTPRLRGLGSHEWLHVPREKRQLRRCFISSSPTSITSLFIKSPMCTAQRPLHPSFTHASSTILTEWNSSDGRVAGMRPIPAAAPQLLQFFMRVPGFNPVVAVQHLHHFSPGSLLTTTLHASQDVFDGRPRNLQSVQVRSCLLAGVFV